MGRPETLSERLRDKRVCVCVGAGGVGKTTVSAALALGLARRGERVLVISIDPARRLATALGLRELPGEPHRLDRATLAEHGLALQGELWAMVLDSKATYDELVRSLTPDERAREEIFANRIYRELSSAVAGSQEFTAVAKLFELHRAGRWDTIVLDTPPSRDALDFLDAPGRLTRFLEGRALKLLLAPGGATRGLLGRGSGLMLGLVARATGIDLLGEMSRFFGALSGMLDGFRERARGVEALLRDPTTAFLIVTSPEHEPAREAAFMGEQLTDAGIPFCGLIVNRVHEEDSHGVGTQEIAALLADELGDTLAARVADNLRDFDTLARCDRETVDELSRALGVSDPQLVPLLDGDVQDLGGLALVADRLLS